VTRLAALLRELAAEFPGYEFSTAPVSEGRALSAKRKDPDGPGVAVVITRDPAEMRAALAPAEIDRASAATPSEQICALLRSRIEAGTYPAGSRVPGNTTLSREFGVANRTVRKALASLVDEGLLEVRPGWGTFVARR